MNAHDQRSNEVINTTEDDPDESSSCQWECVNREEIESISRDESIGIINDNTDDTPCISSLIYTSTDIQSSSHTQPLIGIRYNGMPIIHDAVKLAAASEEEKALDREARKASEAILSEYMREKFGNSKIPFDQLWNRLPPKEASNDMIKLLLKHQAAALRIGNRISKQPSNSVNDQVNRHETNEQDSCGSRISSSESSMTCTVSSISSSSPPSIDGIQSISISSSSSPTTLNQSSNQTTIDRFLNGPDNGQMYVFERYEDTSIPSSIEGTTRVELLTSQQYTQLVDRLTKRGEELVQLDPHGINAQSVLSAVSQLKEVCTTNESYLDNSCGLMEEDNIEDEEISDQSDDDEEEDGIYEEIFGPPKMKKGTARCAIPPELRCIKTTPYESTYACRNCLHTDFNEQKRFDYLDITSDDDDDEDPATTSLPVSIKRDYTLGLGSFGMIYEGSVIPPSSSEGIEEFPPSDDTKVAIKAISLHYFTKYPYLQKQLDNEHAVLRQCMGHPAIVQFEGFTESLVAANQHAFIVMEMMGCNLEDYVVRHMKELRRVPELAVKVIVRQMQSALHFLHGRGISHCDVKPANVLVADRIHYIPHVKLADFGHVRIYGDNMDERDIAEATAGLGLPMNRGFRAPEHATVKGFAPGLDVFGLGAVTYYLLTGLVPHIHFQVRPPVQVSNGKKGKKNSIRQDMNGCNTSIASSLSECLLPPNDPRYDPDEDIFDLVDDPSVWPYPKISYQFCKQLMAVHPCRRLSLFQSMRHEWLSGFEIYSICRRLESNLGLFHPRDRYLTTVMDDVHYQRAATLSITKPWLTRLAPLTGPAGKSWARATLESMWTMKECIVSTRAERIPIPYGPSNNGGPMTRLLHTPLSPPQSINNDIMNGGEKTKEVTSNQSSPPMTTKTNNSNSSNKNSKSNKSRK